MSERKDLEIIYIGDPMCSWCWGFAPVLDEMIANYGDVADFRIIVGGLRPGKWAQLMDKKTKEEIRSHWQHVEEASGQPFDYGFFEREDFLYDTEPAARAVVAIRTIAPEKEFTFFKSLQKGFYSQNLDITLEEKYLALLEEQRIDEEEFFEKLHSDSNLEATHQDFSAAGQMGIRGFPAVVLRRGDELALLTSGYQPYRNLASLISKYFNEAKVV